MNCNFINADLFLKCINYETGLGSIVSFDTYITYSGVTIGLIADDVISIHLVIKDDCENVILGDIVKIDDYFYVSYHCSDKVVVINSVPDMFYLFTFNRLMHLMSDMYHVYD